MNKSVKDACPHGIVSYLKQWCPQCSGLTLRSKCKSATGTHWFMYDFKEKRTSCIHCGEAI